ncbi:DUF421 domain-containing protein [Shimwellia pseudoproteus]|uniref:DUF421 domain-containing protein n=1 Tax=Shimwellia pseudoproteus TaxID=570012 RepID=UPI0018EB5E45|nr:DUF421 domain-containing protein [Shimwellia pseudoproteus]MBJ3815253.1 DUF421 domain-containing protein [Shimwellia pseudoproteus]
MQAFDLHRMMLDKVSASFLWEVAVRCVYTFVLVYLFLKLTGRRGVSQMSLFEVLIILTLGSAAGDVAFYDDVPMLPVLVVFLVLGACYRLVIWLMTHSERLQGLLEGKPVIIVAQGELAWSHLQQENMTEFEFFMELRLSGVSHLGQIALAILETNGQISIYYYPEAEIKPGLPILPGVGQQPYRVLPENGDYACIRCSAVRDMCAGDRCRCSRCGEERWLKASRASRVS